MATVIESDLNRYEVVKVLNPDNQVLNVSMTTPLTGNAPMSLDAFGRQRVSNPLTLFDSSHRYSDNGLWATSTATGGSATFNANQGLVDLTVNSSSGSAVYRETFKVFAYQPGKSLLVFNSFVFNAAKAGLRQRTGYFGTNNGIYLEQDGTNIYFVKRSFVTGSVVNTRVAKADWNVDRLDGTGPSKLTLDLSKVQILFTDIEWLGSGTVRIGFVIDGKFIHCHSFQHANVISSTYITTGCLPLRYEIENTSGTASSSTLKQICSTVLSEGGYELRGLQFAVHTPTATPYDLTNVSTDYPVISIRLKGSPNRLDAVVVLAGLSILGITNNANYRWELTSGGTTTGGTWVSAGTDSNVEYNITGTSFTGGQILASGFTVGSNQGSMPVDLSKQNLFAYQLQRNSFTSTPYELTLTLESSLAGADVLASMDWEEISR